MWGWPAPSGHPATHTKPNHHATPTNHQGRHPRKLNDLRLHD